MKTIKYNYSQKRKWKLFDVLLDLEFLKSDVIPISYKKHCAKNGLTLTLKITSIDLPLYNGPREFMGTSCGDTSLTFLSFRKTRNNNSVYPGMFNRVEHCLAHIEILLFHNGLLGGYDRIIHPFEWDENLVPDDLLEVWEDYDEEFLFELPRKNPAVSYPNLT